MNRYFKVDTDYLKEELQPCLLNMKDSIQKSYQISSKLSVPRGTISRGIFKKTNR